MLQEREEASRLHWRTCCSENPVSSFCWTGGPLFSPETPRRPARGRTMLRCGQALLAVLLCAAGLYSNGLLAQAEENSSLVSAATDLKPTISTTEETIHISSATDPTPAARDTQPTTATQAIPVSRATAKPTEPNTITATTAGQALTATTSNTSNEAASTTVPIGVPTTAVDSNTSTVFPSTVSQTPKSNNATVISTTSNSTVVINETKHATTVTPIGTTNNTLPTESLPPSSPTLSSSTNASSNGGTYVSTQSPNTSLSTVLDSTNKTFVPSVVQTSTTSRMDISSATTTRNTSQNEGINTPSVAMKQVPKALSSGSIAAITVTVIVFVLLVFGGAAYLKIRHSSYGRLVDDHDYGSWGNYNNPLYDDS
ncbi:prostate androgen-regulated mucin-like protein 1 [Ambystoma mexicanum]|uniref:prostate androgen-regulated mucin-like protein 1 n=1 Tax=Ambystoma mexicanum TaxID=8296 RepID=UPI0037E8868C